MRFIRSWMFAAAVALACSCGISPAAQIAFDNAGDSAYNAGAGGGSLFGVNGGYGWGGGWALAPEGFVGFHMFVGSSSTNGSGDPTGSGNINSPRTPLGRAWGIRAVTFPAPGLSGASRAFNGALTPGQTFMIDFDNGSVNGSVHGTSWSGDFVGIGFGGVALVAGQYSYTDYTLLAGGAQIDTGVAITDQGIHIELSIIDGNTTRFSIVPLASPASRATFTFGPVTASSVEIVNNSAYGPESDLYINNMAITPEPVNGSFLLTCLGASLLRRSRAMTIASPNTSTI